MARGTTLSGYGVEILLATIKLYSYASWNYSVLSGAPWRNLLATHTDTLLVSDVIKLDASGTTIKMYVNSVEKLSVTDATHASGQPGFVASSASGSFPKYDDFVAFSQDPPGGGGSPFGLGIDGSWNRNMGHP